jgi:hypothetical protein
MLVQRGKSRTHQFVIGDFLVLLVVSDMGVDYHGSNFLVPLCSDSLAETISGSMNLHLQIGQLLQ